MSITIKDVHNAVRDINMQGGRTEDIEAFLINSDDLHELMQQRDQTPHGTVFTGDYDPNSFELLGIKIIQSPYTERGTIFKIMKNDQKQYAYPTDDEEQTVLPVNQWWRNPVIPVSGMVSNGFKNLGTTAGETAESVNELAKAMGIPKHLFDDDAEKVEAPKIDPPEDDEKPDRHSETRKIKLD